MLNPEQALLKGQILLGAIALGVFSDYNTRPGAQLNHAGGCPSPGALGGKNVAARTIFDLKPDLNPRSMLI